MPIESKNSFKEDAEDRITKCRIVAAGEEAVHEAGERYLPKLDGMDTDQYEAYKARTMFFNATGRTIDGLLGTIFRKDLNVTFDDVFEKFAEDVTKKNVPLEGYVSHVMKEVLEVGFGGTLVDFSAVPPGTSKAQAEKLGYGANWTFYRAENIRNWKYKVINGIKQLSLVVLDENFEKDDEEKQDIYKEDYKDAIRVLKLDEENNYVNQLYVKLDKEFVLYDEIYPKLKGQFMDHIPFILHYPDMNNDEIDPPLIDLVNVNVKHYQLKADHAYALHFVALPTPYIIGVDPNDAPTSVGPSKLWIIPNEEANVGMLEYEGAGIESIATELTKMEQMMAQLGAKILMPSKDFAETATAERIKSTGEHSMLGRIVKSVNLQFDIINEWTANWIGSSKAELELNKDFVVSKMTAQEIVALVAAWQKSAISKQTLFENLKRGEIVESDAEFEDEEILIDEELSTIDNDSEINLDADDLE